MKKALLALVFLAASPLAQAADISNSVNDYDGAKVISVLGTSNQDCLAKYKTVMNAVNQAAKIIVRNDNNCATDSSGATIAFF